MPTEVTMPQMGESVVEGTLERWLVQKGDRVSRDQNLCEITTDKVDAEVPSPTDGVVVELRVEEGATVEVGAVLLVIDASASASAGETPPQPAAPAARAADAGPPAGERPAGGGGGGGDVPRGPRATPMARRVAEERGVDLARVEGSGVSGRIHRADVESHGQAEARPATAAPPAPPAPTAEGQISGPPPGSVVEFLWNMKVPTHRVREGETVTPFSAIRRRVAEHMVVSKIVSPHVGTVAEVDLQRLVAVREAQKGAFKSTHGFSLTYLPFVVQATVRALREYPAINATVIGQEIVSHDEVHVGVAVETERGLLVPVIRNADRLSLVGIAEAIQDLALRARDREITADELSGGTFTVTNPGRRGNLYGFAVINQPQVGILRTGEIRKRPVVVERDGEDVIAIHPTMHVSLSYDHRIIDGMTGNGFLYAVAQHLEAGDFEI